MKFPLLSRFSQASATVVRDQQKGNDGEDVQSSILKEKNESKIASEEANNKPRVTFAEDVQISTVDSQKDYIAFNKPQGDENASVEYSTTIDSFMESDTEDERDFDPTESRDALDGAISDDADDISFMTTNEEDDNITTSKSRFSCSCMDSACHGVKDEVVGTWEDTSNSFYEICHVFTLRENDIRSVSGQIVHAQNEFLPVRRKWIKRHRRKTSRRKRSDFPSPGTIVDLEYDDARGETGSC
mmetsp:Transcript_21867/g.30459  ORF Transcript_21867/g.30459 Transcript_21867/m.30459 type:complete len:243 (+) Transcript_21867:126-854(+)